MKGKQQRDEKTFKKVFVDKKRTATATATATSTSTSAAAHTSNVATSVATSSPTNTTTTMATSASAATATATATATSVVAVLANASEDNGGRQCQKYNMSKKAKQAAAHQLQQQQQQQQQQEQQLSSSQNKNAENARTTPESKRKSSNNNNNNNSHKDSTLMYHWQMMASAATNVRRKKSITSSSDDSGCPNMIGQCQLNAGAWSASVSASASSTASERDEGERSELWNFGTSNAQRPDDLPSAVTVDANSAATANVNIADELESKLKLSVATQTSIQQAQLARLQAISETIMTSTPIVSINNSDLLLVGAAASTTTSTKTTTLVTTTANAWRSDQHKSHNTNALHRNADVLQYATADARSHYNYSYRPQPQPLTIAAFLPDNITRTQARARAHTSSAGAAAATNSPLALYAQQAVASNLHPLDYSDQQQSSSYFHDHDRFERYERSGRDCGSGGYYNAGLNRHMLRNADLDHRFQSAYQYYQNPVHSSAAGASYWSSGNNGSSANNLQHGNANAHNSSNSCKNRKSYKHRQDERDMPAPSTLNSFNNSRTFQAKAHNRFNSNKHANKRSTKMYNNVKMPSSSSNGDYDGTTSQFKQQQQQKQRDVGACPVPGQSQQQAYYYTTDPQSSSPLSSASSDTAFQLQPSYSTPPPSIMQGQQQQQRQQQHGDSSPRMPVECTVTSAATYTNSVAAAVDAPADCTSTDIGGNYVGVLSANTCYQVQNVIDYRGGTGYVLPTGYLVPVQSIATSSWLQRPSHHHHHHHHPHSIVVNITSPSYNVLTNVVQYQPYVTTTTTATTPIVSNQQLSVAAQYATETAMVAEQQQQMNVNNISNNSSNNNNNNINANSSVACTCTERFDINVIPSNHYLNRVADIEVKSAPVSLSKDQLSQAIWHKFMSCQQKSETYEIKVQLWQKMFTKVRGLPNRFGLYMVGSTLTGFSTNSSDIDMCLTYSSLRCRLHSISSNILENMEYLLQENANFVKFKLINARVPILRFTDTESNLEVDLNYNCDVGIKNTNLLSVYGRIDWRVRPLVLVFKVWARYHGINSAKDNTISSYSLALMVIHFLQAACRPAILPCLQGLYPDGFEERSISNVFNSASFLKQFESTNNKKTLGELFKELLLYYSNFQFSENAISIRKGCLVKKANYSSEMGLFEWRHLNIEEPFEGTNTAHSVYNDQVFERVKKVIDTSAQMLSDTNDLSAIFQPIFMIE